MCTKNWKHARIFTSVNYFCLLNIPHKQGNVSTWPLLRQSSITFSFLIIKHWNAGVQIGMCSRYFERYLLKQVTDLRKMTMSLIPTPPPPMGSTVADTFTHVYTCLSTNFSVPFEPFSGLFRYYPQFLCHPIPQIVGNLLFFLNSVPTVLSTSELLYWLERVAFAGLLYGLQDVLVDTEADGAGECEQRGVGDHADQAHVAEWQQDSHDAAEHHTRLLGVSPVHQRLHCNKHNPTFIQTSRSASKTIYISFLLYVGVRKGEFVKIAIGFYRNQH